MPRVHPVWVKDRRKEVEAGTFVSVTTSYNPAAKWLISYLDHMNIPVKVINLGAGVKKIMRTENVCSVCKGKGYVK